MLGELPPRRGAASVPAERRVADVPKGDPMSHTPPAGVARVPVRGPVAPPPNPRRPKLVRDVHGGALLDLFEFFPDLPRPPRPTARVPLRLRRSGR
jgi:hypothetical protein